MIKLIVFDLDGVLVEARKIHFYAFNEALKKVANIELTYAEHLSTYDGLPTSEKIKILKEKGVVSHGESIKIWEAKQKATIKAIKENINPQSSILNMLIKLHKRYPLYCASNSVKKTIVEMLSSSMYYKYIDKIYSNEDVRFPKPHPEIYLRCILDSGYKPHEVLVVEDSHVGRKAAYDAGCNVLGISGTKDLNYNLVMDKINQVNKAEEIKPKWQGKDMNILIPMAGLGSRFKEAGYTFPKPMIDVHDKTMIQTVIDNINIDGTYIFVCQKEHVKQFHLHTLFSLICPKYKIVEVDGITEGAACTTLLARDLIDNESPLLIANSDQYMEWDSNNFMYSVTNNDVDGGILTFTSSHPKWSYVDLDDDGFVREVAEKKVISDHANCGVFYFKKGSDYCRGVDKMIKANDRFNNEFYVAPSINYLIEEGKKFKKYSVKRMHGLGTPEDLEKFLRIKGLC